MIYELEGNYKKNNAFLKYFLMLLKSFFYSLLITIILALALGYRPVLIAGGSMFPTLDYGDVIIIKKPAQKDIKIGDILTYNLTKNGEYCTHRIIDIDEDGNFYTQGDWAGSAPDGTPVPYSEVIGVTYYKFHYIPNFIYWLFNIPNLILFASAIILLFQANHESKYVWNKLYKYL